jgi:GPH family glycoside/pentoside/hexuronide:cation symporter
LSVTATPPAHGPPLSIDVSYGLIALGSASIWSFLSGWLLYFYLPPGDDAILRAPAVWFGVTVLAARGLGVMTTLAAGYLSDHTRSRWGRRLPYMALSALPMLVLFVLIWTPPVPGESPWNLLYLGLIFSLYNVASSSNDVAYSALLPEIAVTDRHRVRMSAWSSGCFLVGMLVSAAAGPAIDRMGYGGAALAYAALALPLFYLPFLVLQERPGVRVPEHKQLDLHHSISTMWHNRSFRVITITSVMYWGVTALVQSVVPFIVTEICLLNTTDTVYFYLPAFAVSLACYPLVTWLTGRFGKRTVFAGSLAASAAVLPCLAAIGDWLPGSLRVQGLVWIGLQAFAMSAVTMLPPVFGAEVIDYDEELTGQRREGIYSAAWGVLDQLVSGLSSAALPFLLLLGRSHDGPRGPLGIRILGPLTGAMLLAAFVVFLRYPRERPLDQEAHTPRFEGDQTERPGLDTNCLHRYHVENS